MKLAFQLIAAIIFCGSVSAQTINTSFSGKLESKTKTSVIHLQNIDGIDISIPVDAQNNFSYKSDSLVKGFYEVDKIGTVYMCPGYQLTVQPNKEGIYVFKGNGALENNALATSKKQLSKYFPLSEAGMDSELDNSVFFIEPSIFLEKLDSFQKQYSISLKKSNDTFFQKYALLNLEFYGKKLLSNYNAFYGIDFEKSNIVEDSIRKIDIKSPGALSKMNSFLLSTHTKQMDKNYKFKISLMVINKWDTENDTLFRNSTFYRQAFQNYFTFMSVSKYLTSDDIKLEYKDPDIKLLTIAKGEIKNPYILAYFDHKFTSSILKQSKDTAVSNKYYNEYLTRASRQDYLSDIKNIYNNSVSYKDNSPAPEFSFKDGLGHPVSLKSLRGKFVYIDVWATWCGPCKAEMPGLKKLEAAYKGKNLEFVSISVDNQQDVKLWKEFVKNNGLKGIQLISDNAFETAFVEKMNINSIPRFILIDPTGKLIAADALRPSNEKLNTLLDKLL